MREEKSNNFKGAGYLGSSQQGSLLMGFGAVLGMGVGKWRGLLQKKGTSGRGRGLAGGQQGPRRRDVLSREKFV